MQWLHKHVPIPEFPREAMLHSVGSGRLHIVKWHEHYPTYWTEHNMDFVATKGYLDMAKWLEANRRDGCTSCAMEDAAQNGHLHGIQWLRSKQGQKCTPLALKMPAENGHLHVLQ